jgi:hypothetical protein
MQPLDEDQDAATEDTVLLMVHKRIRKRESYDLDSVEIIKALAEQGYPLTEKEVMDSLFKLKDAKLLRAYEDTADIDPETGKRIPEKVIRYWNLEITPDGVMRANDIMNRYRTG